MPASRPDFLRVIDGGLSKKVDNGVDDGVDEGVRPDETPESIARSAEGAESREGIDWESPNVPRPMESPLSIAGVTAAARGLVGKTTEGDGDDDGPEISPERKARLYDRLRQDSRKRIHAGMHVVSSADQPSASPNPEGADDDQSHLAGLKKLFAEAVYGALGIPNPDAPGSKEDDI
ncbi:MAG: hypothetical protein ABIH78_04300 [Candidatus Peregrinibacteria bacterium]